MIGNDRVEVRKTHKLFVGGAFPRSESGRTYEVVNTNGEFLANVAKASRKDARDAVIAARTGFNSWSKATAYNRGQVLYRIAEVMEGRKDQFVADIQDAEGISKKRHQHKPIKQSTALFGTPVGRQVLPSTWQHQPVRSVLQLQHSRTNRRCRSGRSAKLQPAGINQRDRSDCGQRQLGDRDCQYELTHPRNYLE